MGFMPHGHCYLWQPVMLWLQLLSNGTIALAYIAIFVTLATLVYRVRDLPFKVMYLAFGVFILGCGLTHLSDVWVIWRPDYWMDGGIRLFTAIVSVGTAISLPPLIPQAVALARGMRAASERGIQLEHAVGELADTYDKAKELDRLKTEFFANISHEFRTPLTLILGPIEELLAKAPAGPERAELETIHRNARSLLGLVTTLLDFSRLEAGRLKARFTPVDLSKLTTELAIAFRAVIDAGDVELVVDCPPLGEPVFVDRELWKRIVDNLLSNASKYTFHGRITVRLRKVGRQAELEVEDTGIGIPSREIPNLFERFHRVQGARSRRPEGTGLGLAMVKDLARLHGGTVTVRSVEDQGSTFTVTLPFGAGHLPPDQVSLHPAEEEPVPQFEPPPEAPPALAALPRVPGQARVLFVDDNADLRAYVERVLTPRWDLVTARDGLEALDRVRAEAPDLVLTDVMMPRMDGLALLQALRSDPATAGIPVMLLTARSGEDDLIAGLEALADDYLVKPFSARELRARVGGQLARAQYRRESEARIERANRDLEAFTSSVSHDLRAPLRAMIGYAAILQEDHAARLDEEGRRLVEVIRQSGARMGRLIDDLLAFSRLGGRQIGREEVDMEALVRGLLEDAALQPSTIGAEVTVGALPPALADRAMVEQVWTNLLSNAFKFSRGRSPPHVEIGALVDGPTPVYFVRDNGVGFDMAHAAGLFGMFQRLHAQKEFEGTGVGLALAHRVVTRHGGKMWAEAKEGEGATFFFTVPPPDGEGHGAA